MTVSIGDRQLENVSGLSRQARAVLGLIDGGHHWLEYALGDDQQHYVFDDEGALVTSIQRGLHDEPRLLLDKLELSVAPLKLFTLAPRDLEILVEAASHDGDVDPDDLKKVLARHRLKTSDDFRRAEDLVEGLGIAGEQLFAYASMEDRLALLRLADDPRTQEPEEFDLREEAAAFALTQAGSVPAFCDYFRCFIDFFSVVGDERDTIKGRAHRVEGLVQSLAPAMFPALNCPSVPGLVAPEDVFGAVREWQAAGQRIGFLTVSQGIQQLVEHGARHGLFDFADRFGLVPETLVDDYLAYANAMIARSDFEAALMLQDGRTCLFEIASGEDQAVIRLDPSGTITLERFVAKSLDSDDKRLRNGAASPSGFGRGVRGGGGVFSSTGRTRKYRRRGKS